MMDAVVATGLVKRFGSVRAVDGIQLVVPGGSAFGLIGQNGAGKTTFIKMLLGVVRPDDGSVAVLGGSPEEVGVRRRIGYLPERLTLPPAFSALSFLDGVARIKRVPSAGRNAEIRDLLALVGLEEVAWKRRIGGYSKGMRQRTGLAAALLGAAELLVLDEPTDGIDPLGRRQIRDIIQDVKSRGVTVFLNSHLLAETERVCDHAAILHRGKVVIAGPLSSLRRKDAFHVTFHEDEHTREVAARHGFLASEPGAGFRFEGTDAAALSSALQRALADGLIVTEVTPELRDLEALLADVNAGVALTAQRVGP